MAKCDQELAMFLNDALLVEDLELAVKISNLIERVTLSPIEKGSKMEMLTRLNSLLYETHAHSLIFSKALKEVLS
ncbi:MAG: hypothetical protein QF415_13610 [Candidatus Undinarchaeales archaeon]|jgi:hypothetical protein|nr:hypothetical protein [Candidatus Undinarchaeales archaeon]MDP7494300.1 hypothetical protein [Candidatus Undinarchaeales archaeon]